MNNNLFFNKQFYVSQSSEFLNDSENYENPVNSFNMDDDMGYTFKYDAQIEILEHIDFNNYTKESLAKLISKHYKLSHWRLYVDEDKLKFLGKFDKKAKLIETKKGATLLSSFVNIYVNRMENHDISNDKRFNEYTNNPTNISYFNSSKEIISLLQKLKMTRKENFEIKTYNKKNSEIPDCKTCNGSGYEPCEKCEGSGREEYLSGYFANGNEKIKVGNCSFCHGSGKVKCPSCKGKGKPSILSDDYQLIRYIEDKYKIIALNFIKLPGTSSETTCSYLNDYRKHFSYSDTFEDTSLQKLSLIYWSELDASEINESILMLVKDASEKIIERNNADIKLNSDSDKVAFKENFDEYKKKIKNFKQEGELVTELCKNISIPTIKLTYNVGDEFNYDIYFFQTFDIKNRPLTIIRFENIPYVSKWRLLF
jgi:hypothetical protein